MEGDLNGANFIRLNCFVNFKGCMYAHELTNHCMTA